MIIYQVMLCMASGLEKEREAFFLAIESCNRLLNIIQKRIAVLPLYWKTNPIVYANGKPQEAINSQLLARADAVVAVFNGRFGTPTGTPQEVSLARARGIPCAVCFFDGKQRITDPDQFKKLQDYKKKLQKEVLTISYSSHLQLQRYLTEWLFALCCLASTKPRYLDQERREQKLKISEYLSEQEPFSNILYTIAGTKADVLSALCVGQDLATFARIHKWRLVVSLDSEMTTMRNDSAWLRSSSTRVGVYVLDIANDDGTDRVAYCFFDFASKIIYMSESLNARLEEMLCGLATVAQKTLVAV